MTHGALYDSFYRHFLKVRVFGRENSPVTCHVLLPVSRDQRALLPDYPPALQREGAFADAIVQF